MAAKSEPNYFCQPEQGLNSSWSVNWGGGGGRVIYSYIRVMPDEFLLKSVAFKLISEEISRSESIVGQSRSRIYEYTSPSTSPPPPN